MTTAVQKLKELQAKRQEQAERKKQLLVKEHASEKLVAKYLVQAVKDDGGIAFKMHPLTNKGIPDYMVIYRGRVFFVETKTTGKTCEPAQVEFHKLLKSYGIDTWVLDRKITTIHDLRLYGYKTYVDSNIAQTTEKNWWKKL